MKTTEYTIQLTSVLSVLADSKEEAVGKAYELLPCYVDCVNVEIVDEQPNFSERE